MTTESPTTELGPLEVWVLRALSARPDVWQCDAEIVASVSVPWGRLVYGMNQLERQELATSRWRQLPEGVPKPARGFRDREYQLTPRGVQAARLVGPAFQSEIRGPIMAFGVE